MKLDFIALDKLVVASTNMRAKGRDPDVADIQPSIAQRGVIVPIIVRAKPDTDIFEIVAGRRRFTAVGNIARDGGTVRPLPCAILDDADDADALEASMLENLARVAPDEVSQWEAFVKLAKAGRNVEEIAASFAFEPQTVRRILALGNLLPRIRTLYRNAEIDQTTVKQLTLASKSQQTAWLALFDDKDAYCPTGFRLKDWLFGGSAIKTEYALFDIKEEKVAVVADLFGDEKFIADSDAFWTHQMAEVEARRATYLGDGWSDVIVLDLGQRFDRYDHRHTSKRQGGRIYVEVRKSGEVTFHEGYLTEKEARARAKSESGSVPEKVQRPEVTSAMNAYIDFHRHAAVAAELARHGGFALRAMAAHVIASNDHFSVEAQSYHHSKDEVQASVEASASVGVIAERRRAVLEVIGLHAESGAVTGGRYSGRQFAPIFARLLELPDALVLEIVAIVMGETLSAGSEAIEAIGVHLDVDLAKVWRPDAAFWSLVRDKEVLGKIVAEVAGGEVAAANTGEKAAVLKAIVTDHLDGTNGRTQVGPWAPKWMAFPPAAYTARGGVGSVSASDRLLHILARAAEDEAARSEEEEPDDIDAEGDADPDDAERKGGEGEEYDPDDAAARADDAATGADAEAGTGEAEDRPLAA